MLRFVAGLGLGVFLACQPAWLGSPAMAQDAFPTKPIRLIVNTAPGGLTDATARVIAEKMREKLGQGVIVENRAGGDGLVGIRAVLAAPADGYTVLASAGTIAIQPAVKLDPGYDLARDFKGVGMMMRSPVLLVVGGGQPYKTLTDMIARSKASPGTMSYASAGVGTATHFGAALMLQKMGLDMLHVPYKGNGPALPDVMAGRVDVILEGVASGAGKIKEGALRALATTSTKRIAAVPEVPTLQEQGVDFSYYLWLCMAVPAATPKPIVDKLNEALRYATSHKEIAAKFAAEGGESPQLSADDFTAFMTSELKGMDQLARKLGIEKQ